MFLGTPLFLGGTDHFQTITDKKKKNQVSYRQQKLQSLSIVCEREEKCWQHS